MLNLWINAEPVLLYRKTSVTSFLLFCFGFFPPLFIRSPQHHCHYRICMHLGSRCIVLHASYTSEKTTTDFTVYIATFGMLIEFNGREDNLLNLY